MAKKKKSSKSTKKSSKLSSKNCFVISPIGSPESDTRKRSDQVLNYVIKHACKKFNYNVIRADLISKSGMITTQIIQHILEDTMVIADLTDTNPNVFYELAIRHGTQKPFIQINDSNTKIPFDTLGLRTIHFDYRFVDSMNFCIAEIEKQLKYFEQHPKVKVESPISTAFDFMSVNEGSQNKKMLKIISDLQEKMNFLYARINTSASSGITSSDIISSGITSNAITFAASDPIEFSPNSVLPNAAIPTSPLIQCQSCFTLNHSDATNCINCGKFLSGV